MDNRSFTALEVRAKEYRRPEDPLECSHQSPVLRATLLHPECVQHFSGTSKTNGLGSLADSEGCEKYRDKPILAPWEAVAWMSRDLQQEVSIPTLVQEFAGSRLFDREAAKDKRS
jgi:hypothetical protein